jgi:hypothetical protein
VSGTRWPEDVAAALREGLPDALRYRTVATFHVVRAHTDVEQACAADPGGGGPGEPRVPQHRFGHLPGRIGSLDGAKEMRVCAGLGHQTSALRGVWVGWALIMQLFLAARD